MPNYFAPDLGLSLARQQSGAGRGERWGAVVDKRRTYRPDAPKHAGMPAKLRKVRTSSGATAVQIVIKRHGRVRVLEHLGSAHNETELAALMETGRKKLHEGQLELDLGLDT